MNRKLIFTFCLLCIATIHCSKEKLTIGRENPELEIQKCVRLEEKKRLQKAIDCYEIFKSRFAGSSYGQEAELKIGDLYFRKKEYLIAADTYRTFLKLNPYHEKADYASYRTGLSYFKESPRAIDRDQQYLQSAADHLLAMIRHYPESAYLNLARSDYQAVREKIAKRRFYIGRFYYRTGEYLAAIPRFKELIDDYPETSKHLKSLYYLTLSHLQLNHEEESLRALTQLQLHYPNHNYTAKATRKMKSKNK